MFTRYLHYPADRTGQPLGEESTVLTAYCPHHDATLLFQVSRIDVLRNTPRGIEVEMNCYCGEHLLLRRGRTVLPVTSAA